MGKYDNGGGCQCTPVFANGGMRCTVRKRNALFMQYPLQKSLHRMRKYAARGYTFGALIFESTSHLDFPERDAEREMEISDFEQRHQIHF
jgi:hypothetical protein